MRLIVRCKWLWHNQGNAPKKDSTLVLTIRPSPIQSVDRDGTYQRYDLELVKMVSEKVTIPVVALGGTKDLDDLR